MSRSHSAKPFLILGIGMPVAFSTVVMLTACGRQGGLESGAGAGAAAAQGHRAKFAAPFATCSNEQAAQAVDLGVARDFNLFLFGDLKQPSADTEGRVAVGGNAELSHYSIGDRLPSDANRADLIVAGNLSWTGGAVSNGAVVVGGQASTAQVSFSHGIHIMKSPIDFRGAYSKVIAESLRVTAFAESGKVDFKTWQNPRGELTLVGQNPSLNVFQVDASTLSRAHTIAIKAPPGSRIIVNVRGQRVQLVSLGMTLNGITRNAVLFNMPDATALEIGQVSFEGSILAPKADVLFSTGVVWGQLIATSMSGQGQMNHAPHDGCMPLPPPGPTPNPTPFPTPSPTPEVPYE